MSDTSETADVAARDPRPDEKRLADYRITVDVWRQYVDTRFNLLRLVPLATGLGVAFVGDRTSFVSALIALTALMSLFGILMYDLRNSVLHDATVHRAKELEYLLKLDRVSGVPKDVDYGGPFTDRPKRRMKLLGVKSWHDRALNIVYSTSAAAWTVVLVVSLLAEWQWPVDADDQWLIATFVGVLAFAVSFRAIASWDDDAGEDRDQMNIRKTGDSGGNPPDDQGAETRQAQ